MAWPCITRACCINRFWSEFDKGDIAVPLVFTKYSDVAEVQHLHPQPKQVHGQNRPNTVTLETQATHGVDATAKLPPATDAASTQDGLSASVMRQDFKAWKVRPEPSCKPRNDYQPSGAPFINETQYQKDYKPWPIPRKGDHPWIPKPSLTTKAEGKYSKLEEAATTEIETGVEKCEIEEKVQEKETKERKQKQAKVEKVAMKKVPDLGTEGNGRSATDALNRQIKQEVTSGSSYRTEFKAYTGVKPVKPIKAQCQYKPPVEDKASLETSYSATYKGEQAKLQPADNKLMERRRIRSLYSEPSKETSKMEKPSVSQFKPKKTPGHSKMVKKVKEKQITGAQLAKKKTSASKPASKPEGVTKKNKEMINRLAETKD